MDDATPTAEFRRRLLAGEQVDVAEFRRAHPSFASSSLYSAAAYIRGQGHDLRIDNGVYYLNGTEEPHRNGQEADSKSPAEERVFPAPLGDGGIRQTLRRRLLAGEEVVAADFLAETGCALSTLRTVVSRLRREGLPVETGSGVYRVPQADPGEWVNPKLEAKQARAAHARMVRAQRRKGASPEVLAEANAPSTRRYPAINSVLRVLGERVDGRRVVITLSDGEQEWTIPWTPLD